MLAREGARPLALACALGWLAFTGYGLAIILVVHGSTHSFGVAGVAVAAFSAGSGLLAPVRGRFIDRRGPGGLAWFVAAHAGAASGLVAGCVLRAPPLVLLSSAAIMGAVVPPVIATARAVWAEVAGPDLSRSGHALNASLADTAQLLSPAVTGALAATFAPALALATLIVVASLAGAVIAWIGRTRRAACQACETRRIWGVMIDGPALRTLVACDVAGGLWAGGMQIAVTALAARRGAAELAAVPLSAAACGGIVASLWMGSLARQSRASSRYVGGSVLVGAVLPLSVLSPTLASVTCISVAAGAGYGVLGAALFELLDQVVASERAVEAFTWLTTGQAGGSAAGAAAARALVHRGVSLAFGLVGSSAAVAAAVAIGARHTLRQESGRGVQDPTRGRTSSSATDVRR